MLFDKISLQLLQTLWTPFQPRPGTGILDSEHALQNISPHPRQWCLSKSLSLKFKLHALHILRFEQKMIENVNTKNNQSICPREKIHTVTNVSGRQYVGFTFSLYHSLIIFEGCAPMLMTVSESDVTVSKTICAALVGPSNFLFSSFHTCTMSHLRKLRSCIIF